MVDKGLGFPWLRDPAQLVAPLFYFPLSSPQAGGGAMKGSPGQGQQDKVKSIWKQTIAIFVETHQF